MGKYKNLHLIHHAEIVTKPKRKVDAWGIEIKKPVAPKYCANHKTFYPLAVKEKYGGCYFCYLERKTKGLDPIPN